MSQDEQAIQGEAAIQPAPKRSFDPGFSRNMKIVGGAFLLAVAVIAYAVMSARSVTAKKQATVQASIPLGGADAAAVPVDAADLTPAELERIRRVQTSQAADAARRGETYIPRDIPIASQGATPGGPGVGYQILTGDPYMNARGMSPGQVQMDPQRAGEIRKGIENQLASIVARNEPPEVASAGAYQSRQAAASSQAEASRATPTSTSQTAALSTAVAATTTGAVLVPALRIAGARLVSPIDTSRGEFVSAAIDSGPLAGAYLIGTVKLSTTETGVSVTFSRMSLRDKDYVINAVALDPATSSNPIGADVDRKLIQRFVLPVFFETAQAYATALARPAQTVVVTGTGTTVASPEAASKEAAAAGISAGMRKAGEAASQAKATAFMPTGTGLPILFLDPVVEGIKK